MGEFLLLKSTLSLIYCYYFQDDVAYIFIFKSIFLIFSLTSIQNNRLFGNFGCWSLNYEKKNGCQYYPHFWRINIASSIQVSKLSAMSLYASLGFGL